MPTRERASRRPGVASPPRSKPAGDERVKGWGWVCGCGKRCEHSEVHSVQRGHFLFGIQVCALECWCGPIHAHGNHPVESWPEATWWTTLVPGAEPTQELPGGLSLNPNLPFVSQMASLPSSGKLRQAMLNGKWSWGLQGPHAWPQGLARRTGSLSHLGSGTGALFGAGVGWAAYGQTSQSLAVQDFYACFFCLPLLPPPTPRPCPAPPTHTPW